MNTQLTSRPTNGRSATAPASPEAFRQPAYDCQELGDAIQLVVYVPGVDASSVEIEGRGADLTVTAKKAHFVRINFAALHLENAQRDYRLRLRLGSGFDFPAMQAQIAHGILTVVVPKRLSATRASSELRRVAA